MNRKSIAEAMSFVVLVSPFGMNAAGAASNPQLLETVPFTLDARLSKISKACERQFPRSEPQRLLREVSKKYGAARDRAANRIRSNLPTSEKNCVITMEEWKRDAEVMSLQNEYNSAHETTRVAEMKRSECIRSGASKIKYTVPLFELPRASSKSMGTLEISFDGEALGYDFVDTQGAKRIFAPDSVDRDWGYSGNFHTILDREGEWVRLPKRPFSSPVWMKLDEEGLSKTVALKSLHIVEIKTSTVQGAVVIDAEESGVLRVHRETPDDMPCGEEAPGREARLKELPRLQLPISQLFDADQHLKFKIKYSRGC